MASSAPRTVGVSGVAVIFAAAGAWLAYAGLRDVPVFGGLRDVIRRTPPTPREPHTPYDPDVFRAQLAEAAATMGPPAGPATGVGPSDSGIDRLRSCAKTGYPAIRSTAGGLTIYGWRSIGSVPNSDHPRGLALDVMNPTALQASQIIATFMRLPGAHYWIWDRQIANVEATGSRPPWQPRPYGGPSPHTDHVHLSFYDRCG